MKKAIAIMLLLASPSLFAQVGVSDKVVNIAASRTALEKTLAFIDATIGGAREK